MNEDDDFVCECRRYFRSILTQIPWRLTNITWNGPSLEVGARKMHLGVEEKTSFSLVCMNVPHRVNKKDLCSNESSEMVMNVNISKISLFSLR